MFTISVGTFKTRHYGVPPKDKCQLIKQRDTILCDKEPYSRSSTTAKEELSYL